MITGKNLNFLMIGWKISKDFGQYKLSILPAQTTVDVTCGGCFLPYPEYE